MIVLFIVYVILKLLYYTIGIGYEWYFKKPNKGFTLNTIASIVILIVQLTLPYQLYLRVKNRKIGNVLDELVEYEYNKAASRDQTGNVVHHVIFNKLFIKPDGYKCGDKDETVSGVLGVNKVIDTLTKDGEWLSDQLDKVDPDHCRQSIDINDIRWETLTRPQKKLLREYIQDNGLNKDTSTDNSP